MPYKGSLLSQSILSGQQKRRKTTIFIFLTIIGETLILGTLLLGVVLYIIVILLLLSLMSR
ncbi:hypothetical protein DIY07_09595 [Streptococcus iniae]|uniref:Uncharacterized protein n=1 Tax=Streptococcus iniae TaxID=1346 RepID=A0A3L8GCV1_STRIN|nr:hypothetical protein DIY09_09490 [Streptococcus iniae]RLU54875.1 hypothetical protein DIY07_09595 [Streptococcus iniae]